MFIINGKVEKMNKKIIVIIGVIIVILIAVFFFYTQNTVKIGNSYFTIPDGYHVVDEGDYVNLTSGSNYICLVKECADENINKSIEKYESSKKVNGNDTLHFSNFSSADINVIKSVSNKDSNVVHYWFVKDGKTYEAFNWAGNSNSDNLLINLIKTMKPAI